MKTETHKQVMDRAYREFAKNPSATNWNRLVALMEEWQAINYGTDSRIYEKGTNRQV